MLIASTIHIKRIQIKIIERVPRNGLANCQIFFISCQLVIKYYFMVSPLIRKITAELFGSFVIIVTLLLINPGFGL